MKRLLNITLSMAIVLLSSLFSNANAAGDADSLDRFILSAIKDKYFPGAQVVVGNSDGVIYSKTYGYVDYKGSAPVTDDTLYDLASCTKVCATTLSIMTLIDEGKITLDTQLGDVIELSDTLHFKDLKIRELLYHTSGFRSGVSTVFSLMKSSDEDVPLLSRRKSSSNPYHYDSWYYAAKDVVYDSLYVSHHKGENKIRISKDLFVDRSYHEKLDSMVCAAYRENQRGRHIYSDLNFYLLQKVVEQEAQMPLDEYTEQIYNKMHLSNIGYNPLNWSSLEKITPTEYDVLFRRDTVRGLVHDELACLQGGVGGNAGLFSSAKSVAQICGMFLRGGVDYNGNRIVETSTVQQFTKIEHDRNGAAYGLGFTKIDSKKRPYTPQSYGHSGFTGTYLWIDPSVDLYMVILTNRTYPSRANRKFGPEFRSEIWKLATRTFL